jgi:hypothetical protein
MKLLLDAGEWRILAGIRVYIEHTATVCQPMVLNHIECDAMFTLGGLERSGMSKCCTGCLMPIPHRILRQFTFITNIRD